MKTQKAKDFGSTSPPRQPRKSRFSLRSRKKKDGVVQGKLRIRSIPGAFLVLGVVVVVVGTALAVAGYWPYRMSRSSMLGPVEAEGATNAQTSSWSMGAKSLLSTAGLVHSERMKLLGPVIMGVGLFILICANTVLYENRDRETQMLLAQMRNVIYSVSAAVPSADLNEMAAANSMSKHYQWVSSLPAAHLNIMCVQQLASSEPLLSSRKPGKQQEEGDDEKYQQAVQWTQALHHQESASTPSLHSSSSSSRNSSKTDILDSRLDHGHRDYASLTVQLTPLSKVSNCLVWASSMSTLEGDELEGPTAQPRRCHSMSYRTNPRVGRILPEGAPRPRDQGQIAPHKALRREPSLQVCVNVPEQGEGPPELTPVEEETRRSWPRLDLGCGRRYLKLENKEDSVDKLLDQMGQQCSPWDKSFGSGPFQ